MIDCIQQKKKQLSNCYKIVEYDWFIHLSNKELRARPIISKNFIQLQSC